MNRRLFLGSAASLLVPSFVQSSAPPVLHRNVEDAKRTLRLFEVPESTLRNCKILLKSPEDSVLWTAFTKDVKRDFDKMEIVFKIHTRCNKTCRVSYMSFVDDEGYVVKVKCPFGANVHLVPGDTLNTTYNLTAGVLN